MAIHLEVHARVPGTWLTHYIPTPLEVICLKNKTRNLEIGVKIYLLHPFKNHSLISQTKHISFSGHLSISYYKLMSAQGMPIKHKQP